MNSPAFAKRDIKSKLELHKNIIQMVQGTNDEYLLKTVLEYLIINYSKQLSKLENLPKIDFTNFEDICRRIFESESIKATSISLLIQILRSNNYFTDENVEVKAQRTRRLCDLVIKICSSDNLKVWTDDKELIGCDTKKIYCMDAIHQLSEIRDEVKHNEHFTNYSS